MTAVALAQLAAQVAILVAGYLADLSAWDDLKASILAGDSRVFGRWIPSFKSSVLLLGAAA